MPASKKMVILDRDGVINFDSPEYIKSAEEWHAIPGSLEAIADLNRAGFLVTIATNQSGVGRAYYTLEILEQIHEKMKNELAIVGGHLDGIYFCPHKPEDNCLCRKPKPGMLIKIFEDFGIDPKDAVFIGDSLRDLEAAQSVNCPAIFIHGNNEMQHLDSEAPSFADLAAAVSYLCSA
jgi:D-glycero-D-manno-heptose 1,7-bisphosphate phosphatase